MRFAIPGQAGRWLFQGGGAVVVLLDCQQRCLTRGTIPVKSCAFGGLSEAEWVLEKEKAALVSWGTLSRAENLRAAGRLPGLRAVCSPS